MIRHLGVLLTARCNLKCAHCLQHRHFNRDLDLALCKELLVEARCLGVVGVSFSGGEPTLYPHLNAVVEECAALSLAYSITTNGTLLDPLLEACSRHIPHHVTLSFDGVTAPAHDAIRGPGTFDRVMTTARLLSGLGVSTYAQFTMTDQMSLDAEMYDALRDRSGAERIHFVPLIQTADTGKAGIGMDPRRLHEIKRWVQQNRARGRPFHISLGDAIIGRGEQRDAAPCGYLAGHSLFVDWDGSVALCCQTAGVAEVKNAIGSLRNDDLSRLLSRRNAWVENLKRQRAAHSRVFECDACHACLRSPSVERAHAVQ
ncbi:radical SAM protein [Aurantimonas marina]|uniref:radical SAM protein n=1 Tax=Aurantimonas marina TaxID=2780508 RepID=UPI0019D041BD|nr:radical SAM protein [Aurantimonas marina]